MHNLINKSFKNETTKHTHKSTHQNQLCNFAEQNTPKADTGRRRNTTTKLTISLQALTPPYIPILYTCLNLMYKSADAIKAVNVSGARAEKHIVHPHSNNHCSALACPDLLRIRISFHRGEITL